MAKRVGCIILAAGWSRRMGAGIQKLLLPIDGHVPMIRHVVETALQCRFSFTAVVVNPAFPGVSKALCNLPVGLLQNHAADEGMSTSFRLGVTALQRMDADAGLFLLGDQPGMEQNVIDRIVHTYECSESILVQASFHGVPGHPVLFDKSLFPYADEITGDEGGRRLVQQFVEKRSLVEMGIQNPDDVDTLDEYKRVGFGRCT